MNDPLQTISFVLTTLLLRYRDIWPLCVYINIYARQRYPFHLKWTRIDWPRLRHDNINHSPLRKLTPPLSRDLRRWMWQSSIDISAKKKRYCKIERDVINWNRKFYDGKLQIIEHSPLNKRNATVEQRNSCTCIGATLGKFWRRVLIRNVVVYRHGSYYAVSHGLWVLV